MTLVLLYVAVVTAAGAVPLGFVLGLRYAAARAELRRPLAPHEALARVYQMPSPQEIAGVLRGPLPKGPA